MPPNNHFESDGLPYRYAQGNPPLRRKSDGIRQMLGQKSIEAWISWALLGTGVALFYSGMIRSFLLLTFIGSIAGWRGASAHNWKNNHAVFALLLNGATFLGFAVPMLILWLSGYGKE